MKLSAVSMNPVGVVPQSKTSKQSNPNYMSNVSGLNQDSFQKSQVNFKGGTSAIINDAEGFAEAMEHFSVLKRLEPSQAAKIDAIRDFVVQLRNEAKAQYVALKFSWSRGHGQPTAFSNTYYEFSREGSSILHPRCHGTADSFYSLVSTLEQDNIKTRRVTEQFRQLPKEEIDRMRAAIINNPELGESDIMAFDRILAGTTTDAKEDVAKFMIQIIDGKRTTDSVDFEWVKDMMSPSGFTK